MTSTVSTAASTTSAGFFSPFYQRWRGFIVQRLTLLSMEMHGSPLKALGVVVISNALFYAIFSRKLLQMLDARLRNANVTRLNRSVHFFALFPLTVMFNIGLAKLTNYQLSRSSLLILSCIAIGFRSFSIRSE